MGLYKYKDFLTFDDVADYLRDKGIYDFDLYEYQDGCKLSDLIWNLIFSYKITPVFHYAGFAYDLSDESNREFLINKSEYKETLIFSESMINDWQNDRVIKLDGVIKNTNSKFYQPVPTNGLQLQEIFNQKLRTDDFYKYKSFKNHKDYVLDISNYTTSIELLVPRIEFDNIFIQPTTQQLSPNINYLNEATRDLQTKDKQIATLQQQLQEAQVRIKELESTQNAGVLKGLQKVNHDTERTRKFAQIIAKAIWDMDKTQAIRTNDMVQFLKPLILEFESTKLPNNDDTVSGWLADVKPPHATQAGRPPKNEPLEIPLIFEK